MVEKNAPQFFDYVTYSTIPLMFLGKLVGEKAWKNVPKKPNKQVKFTPAAKIAASVGMLVPRAPYLDRYVSA